MIRAVGYVRVSTPNQVKDDKTSPQQQREVIKKYIQDQGWTLVAMYEDLGVSGSGMVGRIGLQTLLDDAIEGKFEKLVVHKIDRFGRDARDYKNNRYELEQAGVDFVSINEPAPDDSYNSDFVAGIQAEIAELEKRKIKERCLGGRRRKLLDNCGTVGRMQFGRYYKYTTEIGKKQERVYTGGPYGNGIHINPEAVQKMELVFEMAVGGKPFIQIAKTVKIKYERLLGIIKRQCGQDWTINFKRQKKFKDMTQPVTVTLKQPALLPPEKIKKLNTIIQNNRCLDKRQDVKLFPLSGILKCSKCGRSFTGQRQGGGTKYQKDYYRHPNQSKTRQYNEEEKCREFTYLKAEEIEDRIFKMIFDVSYDKVGFESAIQEGLPDAKNIAVLKRDIDQKQRELKKVNGDLGKLVDMALKGVLNEEVIKGKQDELLKIKDGLVPDIEELKAKFNSLPKVGDVKIEAEMIRAELMDYFSGEGRLKDMDYDSKRRMLKDLFQDGGIYLSKGENGGVEINMKAGLRVGMLNQIKADMKTVEGLKRVVGRLAMNKDVHKSNESIPKSINS